MSAAQISCQMPLNDDWMENPLSFESDIVRANDPDFKTFIKPLEARRMSKVLKRAIATSQTVVNQSEITNPDAIITGTGMGCMENSEKFLTELNTLGENFLKPTLFMQSTHNTVSSQIAIRLGCHGYNNTYSQGEISFDSAFLDAWLQIKGGAIENALVGAHDELTPLIGDALKNNKSYYGFVSEASVSFMLSDSDKGAICEVESVNILFKPSLEEIIGTCAVSDDTVIMAGLNGNSENDANYEDVLANLRNHRIVKYKPLFGDGFSSSAIGVYAAAMMLQKENLHEMLFLNFADLNSWSVIKLKGLDLCGS